MFGDYPRICSEKGHLHKLAHLCKCPINNVPVNGLHQLSTVGDIRQTHRT